MRNPRMGFLTTIGFAMVLCILLAAGSAKAQVFADGLVGLSSSSPGGVYRINEFTGAATPIVTLDSEWSLVGLAYLGQTLYGTDLSCTTPACGNYAVASISTNGSTNVISEQNGSSNWWALAADETANVMYSIDNDNSFILMAQFPDGTTQQIGTGTGISGAGMAYDDTNGILYAVDGASLYTVSVTDGTSTLIGPTGVAEGNRFGLEYDECNQILYMNDGEVGLLYTVNVGTGAATLIGSNGLVGIDGLAWKGSCEPPGPKPIPTMSEWGLMIMAVFIGIAGILTYRKRRLTA